MEPGVPIPQILSALTSAICRQSEQCFTGSRNPIVLRFDRESTVGTAARWLLVHDLDGFLGRRLEDEPAVDVPRPLVVEFTASSLRSAAELFSLAQSLQSLITEDSPALAMRRQSPIGVVVGPAVNLIMNISGILLTLSGHDSTALGLSAAQTADSVRQVVSAVASAARRDLSIPLLDEAVLEQQVIGLLGVLSREQPVVVNLSERVVDGSLGARVLSAAVAARWPIVFMMSSDEVVSRNDDDIDAVCREVRSDMFTADELRLVDRLLGEDRSWLAGTRAGAHQIDESTPARLTPADRRIAIYLGQLADPALMTGTELRAVSGEVSPIDRTGVVRCVPLGDDVYEVSRFGRVDTAEPGELDLSILGDLGIVGGEMSTLSTNTVENYGRFASNLLGRRSDLVARELAADAFFDCLRELDLRGRARAMRRIVTLDASAYRSSERGKLDLFRLARATCPPDLRPVGDPLQRFVQTSEVLADVSRSRTALTQEAMVCAGLIAEVAESVPHEYLVAVGREIIRILVASGEHEQATALVGAWADRSAFTAGELDRLQVETQRELGAYAGFRRRLRVVKQSILMYAGCDALALAEADAYREAGYICWYIGEFADAERFSFDAFTRTKVLAGPNHPQTYEAYIAYLIAVGNNGDRAEAQAMARHALRTANEHERWRTTEWFLRLAHHALVGFLSDAEYWSTDENLRVHRQLLHTTGLHLGVTSRTFLRCQHGLGLRLLGHDRAEAEDLLAASFRTALSAFGDRDHDVLEWFGMFWDLRGESDAVGPDDLKHALRTARVELGPNHPVVVDLTRRVDGLANQLEG